MVLPPAQNIQALEQMMVSPPESTPVTLARNNRTGCGGRLLELLVLLWVVVVTVSNQIWAWVGIAFGAETSPFLATLNQALLLGVPLLLLAWLWRAPRERAMYRAWGWAALYVLLLAATRLLPPVAGQTVMVLQLGATLLFGLIGWFAGTRPAGGAAPATAWYVAVAATALVVIPWLQRGAAGSPPDVMLSLLLGLAFGVAYALIIQRTWFATLPDHTRGRGADLLTGGSTAGVTLLVMASALSLNGAQLMLMLALPFLGWLAVALAYAPNGYDWQPPALFVGLAVFVMLAMTDINPLAVEAGDPALGWIAAAAGLTALIGLASPIAVLIWRSRWGAPGRPALAALAAVAFWLAAGWIYVVDGQPGFYGDRLFVIMKDQVDGSVAAQMTDYDARREFVYSTLVDHANATQADLRQTLDQFGLDYTPYYLVNAVEVEGGLLAQLLLATRPDVDRIIPSPRLRPLPAPLGVDSGATTLPPDHDWNLAMIGADRVWQEFGVRGAGIVVGESDSGVQVDHPELAAGYRGRTSGSDYNWFDPWSHSTAPIDYGGHGTHTTATVLGKTVGVAPEAEWIACANLQRNLGNPALYLDCLQFMLAPFPIGGDPFTDGDATQSAHVLNNSWGCPSDHEGCDPTSLQPAVDALRAAGIFVVAAAGNSGPQCSSLEDPIAIYDGTFTVGAVDSAGDLAQFSSAGPVIADGSGRTKPDIAAPGVSIWSAYPGSTYAETEGTSMAGPHIAGVVALLWSANPALIGDIEATETILRETARPFSGKVANPVSIFMEVMAESMEEQMPATENGTAPPLQTFQKSRPQEEELIGCITQSDPAQTPNNLVGYGIVDAYAAVAAAREAKP